MKKIMKKYQEVYKYCKLYFDKNRKFPLLSEIAESFGFTPEAARQHLERCVSKGYLAKHGWKKRGYTIKVVDILPKDKNIIRNIIDKIKGR